MDEIYNQEHQDGLGWHGHEESSMVQWGDLSSYRCRPYHGRYGLDHHHYMKQIEDSDDERPPALHLLYDI
jgi:hypothetical protein